jgi:hypothetical protein
VHLLRAGENDPGYVVAHNDLAAVYVRMDNLMPRSVSFKLRFGTRMLNAPRIAV